MEDFDLQYYVNKLILDGHAEDVGEITKELANKLLKAIHAETNESHMLIININREHGHLYYDLVLDADKKDIAVFEDWQL